MAKRAEPDQTLRCVVQHCFTFADVPGLYALPNTLRILLQVNRRFSTKALGWTPIIEVRFTTFVHVIAVHVSARTKLT